MNSQYIVQNHQPTSFDDDAIDLLPYPFSKTIPLISERHKRDMFLVGALPVLGACMPKIRGGYGPFSKFYSTHLYSCILGPASGGKSILRLARRLAANTEKRLFGKWKVWQRRQEESDDDIPFNSSRSVFIPGDISAAALIERISANKGRGLIFEEEIDSVTKSFKQEWGQFSDMLRKGWEHEPISVARKKSGQIYIPRPSISVALSGTPNQIFRLIQDNEDGLFSRFAFYLISQIDMWKSPKPTKKGRKLNNRIATAAGWVDKMRQHLEQRSSRITFELEDEHWKRWNDAFRPIHNEFARNNPSLISIVRRAGAIAFRMAMIFTALRTYHREGNLKSTLKASDEDIEAALSLAGTFINHGCHLSEQFNDKTEIASLKRRELDLYQALPESFERSEANTIGEEELGVSERTVYNYIMALIKAKLVKPVGYGKYEKTQRSLP